MLIIGLGALLVIAGLLYMAGQAIQRGRLSGPTPPHSVVAADTLEPERRGLRFLGLGANWPGFALMALGALLLLGGAFV